MQYFKFIPSTVYNKELKNKFSIIGPLDSSKYISCIRIIV